MAVIITNMDMPKSCFECDKTYKWKKDGKVQCPHINMPSISSNTTNRPSYCPLKSTDEMCTEIQDVYVGYRHGYEVMHDVVDIINKYCKENTDNNN